jgi:hypothetical protein
MVGMEEHVLRLADGFVVVKDEQRAFVQLLQGELLGADGPDERGKSDRPGNNGDEDNDQSGVGQNHDRNETGLVDAADKKAEARYKAVD